MSGINNYFSNNNIFNGTEIPTQGKFDVGDIVVNIGENAEEEPMWICIEAGEPGVWKVVGKVEDIDLSGYQEKTDENLATESKDLVGAINELFQSANNGKELIASAIGEPLNTDDTFSAMSDKINDMKSNLKQVLTDEGVSVTEEDDMASLITKVDEEFDRKTDVKIGSYMYPITMTENIQKITINHNLGKTPSFVNIYIPYTSLYYLYGGYENYLQTTTTRAMNHIIDSRVYYDTDHCFIVLADSNRYIHAYITDITDTSFSFAMRCGMEGSGYEMHLDSFDWVVM